MQQKNHTPKEFFYLNSQVVAKELLATIGFTYTFVGELNTTFCGQAYK